MASGLVGWMLLAIKARGSRRRSRGSVLRHGAGVATEEMLFVVSGKSRVLGRSLLEASRREWTTHYGPVLLGYVTIHTLQSKSEERVSIPPSLLTTCGAFTT